MNKEHKKSDTALAEEAMLEVWKKEKTFQKSLTNRKGRPYFSFYDGPPFANGLPHYGHVVPSTIKDSIARYKTMQGFFVPRIAGWDTHGLPVEYDVEKQLGIKSKREILKMGVEKFNQACRDSVFRYKNEFEEFILRLGRWVDLENAYATLDDNYIESVWHVFAELNKKGLVYKSFRSMPYCPRCATPLSNFELNQGYQDNVEDPSVFALFPLSNDSNVKLLAWTTTPWTLPANAALAVDPKADYAYVELKSDHSQLVLALKRLNMLDLRKAEYKLLKKVKGKDLVGLSYQPLYKIELTENDTNVHKVYSSDTGVDLEEGTGILHIAPRYGEFDLELGLKEKLPLIESVDSDGLMVLPETLKGQFFKDADDHIIAELTKQNRLFAAERFHHTYPFCWRCDTPLMYFATPSWFIAVSKIKETLVETNNQVNWVPKHIKKGRFGNWIAEARDWGVSRNRFWGSPLPVWQCEDEHYTIIGSIKELEQKALNYPANLDMHRPGIDNIKIKCDECAKPGKRIDEVFDCWFESGAMPYASVHYPMENEDEFKEEFPADFISEGLDQTRGWFYTLHVEGGALFESQTFKNVICHGIVVAGDGKKLSKRLRNYPPLDEVFNTYGSDILRFFMLNSPVVVGEEVRFSAEHLRDTQRNIFMTLQNSFNFFKTYSTIDNWKPEDINNMPESDNLLDKWMIARLSQTVEQVTEGADKYLINKATRPIVELLNDLSNWYIRRSRRRFWKSENDNDKRLAYATLHYVLFRTCQLLAPWAPFISDRLWRELAAGTGVEESVHLSDWPTPDNTSRKVLDEMKQVREAVITEGLSQRAASGIKVRQPLAAVKVNLELENKEEFAQIIAEELNVKEIIWVNSGTTVKVDTKVTDDLKAEGWAREVIRHIQSSRKKAGYDVENRIKLSLDADDKLQKALDKFQPIIFSETLTAEKLIDVRTADYSTDLDVDGQKLKIAMKRA